MRNGRGGARGGGARRQPSLCERVCQLPHLLLSDGGAARATFERDEATGMARLSGTGGSAKDGLTALRRKEMHDEDNLAKFLLADDKLRQSQRRKQQQQQEEEVELRPEVLQGIGSECDICSINVATHFALPCQHVACRACWGRWLAEHPGCMTCTHPVHRLRRFPLDKLPLTAYEKQLEAQKAQDDKSGDASSPTDAFRMSTVSVEQSLEHSVRSILLVKDKISSMVTNLHTVESHLFNITRPEPGTQVTVDTLTSVLAVEQSSVVEQLAEYDEVFKRGKDWDTMDQELAILLESLGTFSKLLDARFEAQDREERGSSDAKDPTPTSDESAVLLEDVSTDQAQGGLADASLPVPRTVGDAPSDGEGATETEPGAEAESAKADDRPNADLEEALATLEILVAKNSISAQWDKLKTLLGRR
ncbi:E3 ubiquitin-protein ligase RNF149 [Durusdinium trenchii]|uniref:E3 ubiquitin-protein ligase RNF149 n=1 Tax=Durusdinium trenchii TaxID=1381693 RepID=A0ABP0I407_9DINO